MFGKPRLSMLIHSLAPTGDAGVSEIARRIVEEVRTFTSGNPQNDDITLLAVRFGATG
jgi:serine phosphatase RsbU (regulator of sigma subunit)